MAMNKREREQLAEAVQAAEMARALRWSDYPKDPDLPKPAHGTSGRVNGWRYSLGSGSAMYPPYVRQTWSTTVHHGEVGQSGSSQDAIAQYSTRLRALGALRRGLERRAAAELAEIDRQIAAETLAEAAPTADAMLAPEGS